MKNINSLLVRNLGGMIEAEKDKISKIGWRIAARIEEIQNVIPNVVAVDYLFKDTSEPADVNLPPEFELTDLRHLKQIHTIMLQHNVYVGYSLSIKKILTQYLVYHSLVRYRVKSIREMKGSFEWV